MTAHDPRGLTRPPDQLTLDEHDPDAMADRGARLRAELDRLDAAKASACLEALDAVRDKATAAKIHAADLDATVAEARAYGATWQQIADAAGMARPSAWQRWSDRG